MISKLKTDKSTNLTQVVEKVNVIVSKLNTLVALKEIETEERLAKKGIIKCVADKPPTDKHDEGWGKCVRCGGRRITPDGRCRECSEKENRDHIEDSHKKDDFSCEYCGVEPSETHEDDCIKTQLIEKLSEVEYWEWDEVLDFIKANFKSNDEIKRELEVKTYQGDMNEDEVYGYKRAKSDLSKRLRLGEE
jgi:hypothetical protein